MGDRLGVALAPAAAVWPPDDTEESVLGTSLHQTAIRTLISAINEAAAVAVPAAATLPWQAGGQTMVRGWRRWDGSAYTTLPDVFVYPKPWDDERGSLHLATDGPPMLIIEVLSKETYKADLDLEKGKGSSYRVAGVAEYLALDPSYQYAPTGRTGWRLEGGAYRPWPREHDGRWASQGLPLSFGLEGALAAVYASDGHRFLREGEVERTVQEQQRALQERDRRFAEQERLRREERGQQEASERRLREELAAQEQRLARETQERQRAEAEAEQERLRREALALLEQAHAAELERLRRRLEELERGS
jgi:hypothetical protein